jgi:Transposase DDE domain group 1
VVGHVGAALVAQLADHLGFTSALSAGMAHTRQRRSAHDPGVVLAQFAVMLVNGGDCLSDLAALRDQPELFGQVASNAAAWRVIDSIHSDGMRALLAARASARERAWSAGARPDEFVLDVDATLVAAHSEKEDAAPNYKHGFGFHPMRCYLYETGEALAAKLRPGNAGSNDAADHVEVVDLAIEQLPADIRYGHQPGDERGASFQVLVRADSAGATHDFIDALIERDLRFSIGFPLSDRVRTILTADQDAWVPALTQAGGERDGAAVVERDVVLAGWPEGVRVICRRERRHPGAQFTFTDHNGYRFQCFITDQTDTDIAALEARRRQHACVENLIHCAKQTGLENFPFDGVAK